MPLFVIKEKIEKLDIDAVALPIYDGLIDFYKNNYFNSENLLNLYNSFLDKDKIKKLSYRLKDLKNRYKKLVEINRSHKIENKYSKIINEIVFKEKYKLSYDLENRRTKKYSKIDILEIIKRHPELSENKKKQLIEQFSDSDTVPEENEKYNISELLKKYPTFKKLSEEQLVKELELFEKYIDKTEKFEKLEEITKNNIEELEDKLLTINKIKYKYIITFNFEINDFIYSPFENNKRSNLSNIYEKVIDVALSNNFSQIAIPVIDFKDMPNRNYYIDTERDALREYLDKPEKDIIVYLILTDINNDYCQDSEPENIYEKISSLYKKIHNENLDRNEIEYNAKNELKKYKEYLNPDKSEDTDLFSRKNDYRDFKYNGKDYSDNDYLDFYFDYLSLVTKNSRFLRKYRYGKYEEDDDENEKEQNVEDLEYWDEKAFWEEINRRREQGYCFSIGGGDKFPKYRKNNKRILDKLGLDLKTRIILEDKQENCLIADKLHKEIESLINSKTESFSQMVLRIINETDRDRVKCYKSANVDKNIFSKIVKDASGDIKEDGTTFVYKPDKKIVLAFAIALRLKINEANELLRKAGYAFSNYPQDIIVKSFIEKGIYDIDIVNQFLLRFHQPLLGSTARE